MAAAIRMMMSWRHLPLTILLLSAACAPSLVSPPPASDTRPVAPAPTTVRAPATPAKPAWVARRVVADAHDAAEQRVTVKPGDSLSAIANRTGASVRAIAVANRIPSPYVIDAGQVLRVPAGRYHTVKSGETGIAIARAYGIDWDDVIAANDLQSPFMLRVGERLRLPTRAAAKAMTLEQRAAAFRLDIDDLIAGGEPAEDDKTTPPPTPNAAPAPAATAAKSAQAARPGPEKSAQAKTDDETRPAGDRFSWPLDGRILSGFGAKANGRYNDGINIKAASGTPFRAAADGIVAYAGDAIEGFGNLLLIKHSDGWVTAYAHAEALLVTRNERVRRGDIIGRVGRSGSVDSPQLHFEIRRGRTPVDPRRHLPVR